MHAFMLGVHVFHCDPFSIPLFSMHAFMLWCTCVPLSHHFLIDYSRHHVEVDDKNTDKNKEVDDGERVPLASIAKSMDKEDLFLSHMSLRMYFLGGLCQ